LPVAIIGKMNLKERIQSFSKLGEVLRNSLNGSDTTHREQIESIVFSQYKQNPWFTPENVRYAINAIATKLTEDNLIKWTRAYPSIDANLKPARAGVIMAGNIPLVGFHDFLSVLITGNIILAKTSTKDSELIHLISEILCSINPALKEKIEFTENILTGFDLVIATGSNNSSRYFEYYFGKVPNIIRKNRNSIAIITGNETDDELRNLGTDIFSYFGFGCRNVSKIYLPDGYEISELVSKWEPFNGIISHSKYANNYDFNKAVYIVNKEKFHDSGFLLLKEDAALSSPISVLHYEYYNEKQEVIKQTEYLKEKIQCIIGSEYIPFGKAQSPDLWDYADGIDTIEFLLKKNKAGIL
jgi:hypothetical protein